MPNWMFLNYADPRANSDPPIPAPLHQEMSILLPFLILSLFLRIIALKIEKSDSQIKKELFPVFLYYG